MIEPFDKHWNSKGYKICYVSKRPPFKLPRDAVYRESVCDCPKDTEALFMFKNEPLLHITGCFYDEYLGIPKKLKVIDIIDSGIESTEFMHKIPNLEEVKLQVNLVDDRGLKDLGRIKNLKVLDLRGNLITTTSKIREIEDLEYLDIDNNKITDPGEIKNLSTMKSLKTIRAKGMITGKECNNLKDHFESKGIRLEC